MKNFSVIILTFTLFPSCNNGNKTESEGKKDSIENIENKKVDNLINEDSLKIIEKEKELLEKYK